VESKNQNAEDIAGGAVVDYFGFLTIYPVAAILKWIFKSSAVLERSFKILGLAKIQEGGIIQDGGNSIFTSFSKYKFYRKR
jgi:hypothetical protein